MKTGQAWAWLAVGVMAAGLNAAYHDGGLAWVHRAVEEITYQTSAVLGLASGRADWFLAEARLLTAQDEAASLRRAPLAQGRLCRMATAMARVQAAVARSEAGYGRLQAMSPREQEQLARREANRAQMEARIAARAAPLNMARAAFNSAAFSPVAPVCPRVRVSIPPIPRIRVPALPRHIELPGTGPV
jgi:hypothetical protein